ncbi:MAG: sigma-70 family RNA polymerase sigma factor [Planctomycetes bacterium]|nr:sigma-70 family RNA polymerase sigma factor [Planctomycetota bacterium]
MRDRTVDRLFESFRTRGDVRALGDVFDATSDELLRVATSLTRDLAEAEDLLQATFVTAIERAKHWDSEQRLVPWLCGILVRHAHARRRERTRVLDVERLEREPEREPNVAVEHAELERELDRALAGVSDDDRAVLVKYLREGKEPIEIAREAHIAPGTARMRVHRGLERLRKLLPASFALGASAMLAGRGLAAVRAEVVREATASAAKLATGVSISSTASAGAALGAKKFVLAASVVFALLAALWWRSSTRPDAPASPASARTEIVADTDVRTPSDSAVSRSSAAATDATAEDGRSVASVGDTYSSALVRLRGRVLDASRQPVHGIEVALIEFRSIDGRLSRADALREETRAPRLEIGRTTTEIDGRFALAGARTDAIVLLGIGLGDAGASLHLVREAFEPGGSHDLGDFSLPPLGEVHGRVVDESGRPLVGVRVRAGEIAAEWLDVGLERLRRDSLVVMGTQPIGLRTLMPSWLGTHLDRLPIATTYSAADGSFRLPGVPLHDATLVVDAPQRVSTRVEKLALVRNRPNEIGDVVLARGSTERARVVGADGTPIAGADVRIGTVHEGFISVGVGFFDRARELDAGGYEGDGLGGTDSVWVAARRDSTEPWVLSDRRDATGALTVTLATRRDRTLHVCDEFGESIAGAEIALLPGSPMAETISWFSRADAVRATSDGDGRASIQQLADGSYDIAVLTPTGSATLQNVAFGADKSPFEIVVARGAELEFTVLDAASGEPVERAQVTLGRADDFNALVARATTDAAGRAHFRGLDLGDGRTALHARVDQPGYGRNWFALAAADRARELRLPRPGALDVELAPDAVGDAGWVLVLDAELSGDVCTAQHAESTFVRVRSGQRSRVPALAPGQYSWVLAGDLPSEVGAYVIAKLEVDPKPLTRGRVTIESGREVQLVLDSRLPVAVAADGNAALIGTVLLDGTPAAGLSVRVLDLAQAHRTTRTDSSGRFRLDGLTGPRVGIGVYRKSGTGRDPVSLGVKIVELRLGAETEITLDWHSVEVSIDVVDDATGRPVPNAVVLYFPPDRTERGMHMADDRGRATFVVASTAGTRFRFDAGAPERARSSRVVDVGPGQRRLDLELRLSAGVSCSGRIRLVDAPREVEQLEIRLTDDSGDLYCSSTVTIAGAAGGEFSFEHVLPGRYTLIGVGPERELEPVPFQVPPSGATQLEVDVRTAVPSVTELRQE